MISNTYQDSKDLQINAKQHKKYVQGMKALVVLNLLDIVSTISTISYHSSNEEVNELNPIMDYFLESSFVSFACFKIFVMQLVLMVVYGRMVKTGKYPKFYVLVGLIVVYSLVICWNFSMLFFPVIANLIH